MTVRNLAAMGLLVGIATLACNVEAATFTVTTTADTPGGVCDAASCTLREAILAADLTPGADDVNVPAGNYVLMLGQLDISDDLTVTGAGAGSTVIDGNASSRVIRVDPLGAGGLTVELVNVLIQNGNAGDQGGCIRNPFLNTLTLTDSSVSGCTSGANIGGGIYNLGSLILDRSLLENTNAEGIFSATSGSMLTIRDSTVRNNTWEGIELFNCSAHITGTTIVGNQSSGVYVSRTSSLILINSTISGNLQGIDIEVLPEVAQGTVGVSHSTIADNTSVGVSGGIDVFLTHTIVSGNSPNCSGAAFQEIRSLGYNLDDDGSCPFTAPGDLSNVADAGLGALADHGGPTETHSLLPGSPAIDAGRAFDQRGMPLEDGDGDTVIAPDLGAYELPEPMAAVMLAAGALLLVFLGRWRARRGA
jgi:CSLREA domain-containing protein